MSAMCCAICTNLVDTDFDPDSLYVPSRDGECICQGCRNEHNLPSEFEEEEHV